MGKKIGNPRDACVGKVRFETMSQAQKTAKYSARRNGGKLHPYRCTWCGGFHVGSVVGHPKKKTKQDESELYA